MPLAGRAATRRVPPERVCFASSLDRRILKAGLNWNCGGVRCSDARRDEMALPLPPGLTPSEVGFLCEMELVTVIPRQRLEGLELLGVSAS